MGKSYATATLTILALATLVMGIAFLLSGTWIPECVTEDTSQTLCKWDASNKGNGRGTSFIKAGRYIFKI